MFWRKAVLKICSKFNREHPCRGVISIKLLCNFIEITLWHGYSAYLLHIFRTPFLRKSLEGCLFVKYFPKKLHHEYLTKSWIYLWNCAKDLFVTSINSYQTGAFLWSCQIYYLSDLTFFKRKFSVINWSPYLRNFFFMLC